MKKKKATNNWVAKHARTFNRSAVFKDRKKADKRCDCKYKNQRYQIAA